jgi:hypothetical protein
LRAVLIRLLEALGYIHNECQIIHTGVDGIELPPASSLEESEENLEGEDKRLFLEFMQKMLRWVPVKRKSPRELLEDPWLKQEVE